MRILRYIIRNFTLLNMLLFTASVVIVASWAIPMTRMGLVYPLPVITARVPQEEQRPVEAAAVLPSDFAVIGEMNLFHPERIVPVDKNDEAPGPELVLYGTLVADGFNIAYVEDKKKPKTTPGRGKRQSVIKPGDIVSGFTVKEIMADRIVLTKGGDTITVLLDNPDKRKNDDSKIKSPGKGDQAGSKRQPVRSRPSSSSRRMPPSNR